MIENALDIQEANRISQQLHTLDNDLIAVYDSQIRSEIKSGATHVRLVTQFKSHIAGKDMPGFEPGIDELIALEILKSHYEGQGFKVSGPNSMTRLMTPEPHKEIPAWILVSGWHYK